MLTGRKPDISYLRVFGCAGHTLVLKDKRTHKMEANSEQLIFVGYEPFSKGYRLWNPRTHKIVTSTDVIFDETLFPSQSKQVLSDPKSITQTPQPESISIIPTIPVQVQDVEPEDEPPEELPIPAEELPIPAEALPIPAPLVPIRQRRVHDPPDASLILPNAQTCTKKGINSWRANHGLYLPDNSQEPSSSFEDSSPSLNAVLLPGEPASYREAMRSVDQDHWVSAMNEEIDSLKQNNTWELVDLPAGRKVIKSKWVYRLKFDSDGNPVRYKARLVAKGFTQIFGLDYDETFSPVARLDSMRILLALAAQEDWEIHQIDVKTAFLNGELDEEIYMQQPEGYSRTGQEIKVCLLLKALYGLKQASRQWHIKLNKALTSLDFISISADPCVYINRTDGIITILVVYVDDITLLGNSLQHIKAVKDSLGHLFQITDLGEMSHYLGFQIIRNRPDRSISIDQHKYIGDVLNRFRMNDCTALRTPFAAGMLLTHNIDPVKNNDPSFITQYQSLIGSLMYAMLGSRPDLSYSVGKLSQFASNPTSDHMAAAKQVLRYLRGTQDLRLVYGGETDNVLHGFSYSDWGSDPNDQQSTTGYTFRIAGGAVSWASRKQPTVALSTTEAEYMATSDAARHAIWIRSFLTELSFPQNSPTVLSVDNKGAIDLANNPVHHKRTKHINIRHHFIRECLDQSIIKLDHVSTCDNISDILTKNLPYDKHSLFWESLGLSQTMDILHGGVLK